MCAVYLAMSGRSRIVKVVRTKERSVLYLVEQGRGYTFGSALALAPRAM